MGGGGAGVGGSEKCHVFIEWPLNCLYYFNPNRSFCKFLKGEELTNKHENQKQKWTLYCLFLFLRHNMFGLKYFYALILILSKHFVTFRASNIRKQIYFYAFSFPELVSKSGRIDSWVQIHNAILKKWTFDGIYFTKQF